MDVEPIREDLDVLCGYIALLIKQEKFKEVDEILHGNIPRLSFAQLIELINTTYFYHEQLVCCRNMIEAAHAHVNLYEEKCTGCGHIFHEGDLRAREIYPRQWGILCHDCNHQQMIDELSVYT